MVFPFFVLLFVCKLLYYYYFSNCGLWSSWLTLCLFLVHVIALLCFAYFSLFIYLLSSYFIFLCPINFLILSLFSFNLSLSFFLLQYLWQCIFVGIIFIVWLSLTPSRSSSRIADDQKTFPPDDDKNVVTKNCFTLR